MNAGRCALLLTLGGCTAQPLPAPFAEVAWTLRRENPGPDRIEDATDVAVGPDGSIAVTGAAVHYNSLEDESDALTLNITADGELLWADVYRGLNRMTDVADGVAIAGDGTIYVTVSEGWFFQDLPDDATYAIPREQVVLLAYGPDGAHRWRREVERDRIAQRRDPPGPTLADGHVFVRCIRRDPAEVTVVEVSAAGNERSRISFLADAIHTELVHSFAVADGYALVRYFDLVVLSADGGRRWTEPIDVGSPHKGAATPDGGLVIVGGDGGDGPRTFLQRWTADGDVAWTREWEPPAASMTAGVLDGKSRYRTPVVAVDPDGTIAVATAMDGGVEVRLFAADGRQVAPFLTRLDPARTPTVKALDFGAGGDLVLVGTELDSQERGRIWVQRLSRSPDG